MQGCVSCTGACSAFIHAKPKHVALTKKLMGHISYLAGPGSHGPQSIEESIYELENTSVLFREAWQRTPQDFIRASRVSGKAMEHLDHIVNEILRARDTRMSKGTYSGSPFKAELNVMRGLMSSPVTSVQQQAMINAGPGQGQLPGQPVQITLEKLLNKIKHRHHKSANFRIQAGRHIFVINVDTPNRTPDSIAEFDVADSVCTPPTQPSTSDVLWRDL